MVVRLPSFIGLLTVLVALSGPALAAGVDETIESFVTHDGYQIQCHLSYPDRPGERFPAMLMIAGSGLHDADVTIDEPTLAVTDGQQALFRPLARHFSRRGWAVMRCNKRGATFQHRNDSSHLLEAASLEDLVEDAHTALRVLHSHPRILASPLVVFGHSEGANIATRLALQVAEIDLLVLVGSAGRPARDLLEYQLVERNLNFFRQAADANGDGSLTLGELDGLDGKTGMGSIYVYNSAEVLFRLASSTSGEQVVRGFNPITDSDGDGRLEIGTEIEPRLRHESDRFLTLAANGSLGRYWQSTIESEALIDVIHRVEAPILFVHGELDAQIPLDEPLAMMARLESRGRSSYDLLVFPEAGHSLSRPNDFYLGDEGLTLMDNLTLNAPPLAIRRQILRRIEAILAR